MAVNREAARRRVKVITGSAAAGAIALTAGFAYGASHGPHAAHAHTGATTAAATTESDDQVVPAPQQSYGYQPPTASQAPPSAMSGGS